MLGIRGKRDYVNVGSLLCTKGKSFKELGKILDRVRYVKLTSAFQIFGKWNSGKFTIYGRIYNAEFLLFVKGIVFREKED